MTAAYRPKRWKAEVVTLRADSDEGWATLCKEFGPMAGRPVIRPEQPWLAIFGRVTPTRLGWPVYVRAEDTLGVMRYRAEKLAEARVVAHENNQHVDRWEAQEAADPPPPPPPKRKRPGSDPAAKNADADTPHSEQPSVPASAPNQGETK